MLVSPQLEYAAPVWDPHSKEKILQLEKVQHRAAHWTTSSYDYRSSVTAMVNSLGWRTLEQRWADARLFLFYKIVYGLVAVPLPDYIQPSNRVSWYCHSMTFRKLQASRDYYKYSFFSTSHRPVECPCSTRCTGSGSFLPGRFCLGRFSQFLGWVVLA